MKRTPISPGSYLRISARVKAIAGNLPQVRIAAFAGDAAGNNIPGVVQAGPQVTLPGYGQVVEVSAIVGSGRREGVDMAWIIPDSRAGPVARSPGPATPLWQRGKAGRRAA